MVFTVGIKVVSIPDEEWIDMPTMTELDYGPDADEVCTVSNVFMRDGYLFLEFVEYPNMPEDFDPGFPAVDFRPLVETKQETCFTVGADPESEKWDNRKPMPVYSFDVAGHEDIMRYLRGFY